MSRDEAAREPRSRAGRAGRSGARTPRRELAVFLSVAVLTLLAVGTGSVLISNRIARDTALDEAEDSALRIAHVLIEPLFGQVLHGHPASLDHVLTDRLEDGSVTTVLVWTPQGQVLYASDKSVEGRSIVPGHDLSLAASGVVTSDLDGTPELGAPPDSEGPFLEVYAPIEVEGNRLIVEAYFSAAVIDHDAALVRSHLVPLTIGALAVLQLVQVPIAVSLGRRLSRQEQERRQLVERSLRASDRERQAIAAIVHDGPVQELAGVGYALGGLRVRLPEAYRTTVDWLLAAHQAAVASLRSLMVDIHPPDLGDGLGSAFEDLAVRLRERGLAVHVTQADPLPAISPTTATLLYRSGREGLANILRHAHARNAWVSVAPAEGDGSAVRLTIADDGVGFPDGGPVPTENGHLGLRLVRDQITGHGGSVTFGARPGGGAVVDIVLPIDDGG